MLHDKGYEKQFLLLGFDNPVKLFFSHSFQKKFLWPDIFLMEKDFFTQKFQKQISLKLSNLVNYLRRGEVYISLKHWKMI